MSYSEEMSEYCGKTLALSLATRRPARRTGNHASTKRLHVLPFRARKPMGWDDAMSEVQTGRKLAS
jgi:hypothetical protein